MKPTATLLLLAALTAHAMPTYVGPHDPLDTSPDRTAKAEVSRIRDHLLGAEQVLKHRDTASLSPAQRRARRKQIDRLRGYVRAGEFPHNHDFEGRRKPYFVDRHGTRCAMAYLIETSGRRDIVEQVAVKSNNATVTELAHDPVLGPVLAAWLSQNGLTVEEAQRIQPAYCYTCNDESEISTGYAAASVGLGALNLVSVGVNAALVQADHRRTWTSALGLASGVGGVVLGAVKSDDGEPVETLAIVNMMVGTASVIASVWALTRSPEAKAVAAGSSKRVTVVPVAALGHSLRPMLGIRAAF